MVMAYELVYTSAPAGIRPGSSGFCVVACTENIPAALAGQLEKLSAYKPYFPEYDELAAENPVACAHLTAVSGGQSYHLLSRICHNGLDYTGRSNKLASHLALARTEAQKIVDGPAALFLCPGLFREADWEIKATVYPEQLVVPEAVIPVGIATAWEKVTGNAGGAGVLAESWQEEKAAVVYLVFDPCQPVPAVQMIHESLSLLPSTQRWQVTFNTYFTGLNSAATCQWRFCAVGSELLREAKGRPGVKILDLTQTLPPATGGRLVAEARSGQRQPEQLPVIVPAKIEQPVEKEEKVPLKPLPPRKPMAGVSRRGQRLKDDKQQEKEDLKQPINQKKSSARGKMVIFLAVVLLAVLLLIGFLLWCCR